MKSRRLIRASISGCGVVNIQLDDPNKREFVIITTYDTLQARHLDWKPEIRVSETEQLTAY